MTDANKKGTDGDSGSTVCLPTDEKVAVGCGSGDPCMLRNL